MSDPAVLEWLLDSDPAIRWQVERDILHARPARWQATRARVETEGWGARLLSLRDENGIWAGVAFWPKEFSQAAYKAEGQAWTATSHCLTLLHQMGLTPPRPLPARSGIRWAASRCGRRAINPSGRAKPGSASTVAPSRMAFISARMFRGSPPD